MSLSPTWRGHVSTTRDALILFEACLRGMLQHVPRRPHDRERPDLIKSGHVFIYEENASGIKRWTDGLPWSPSRILGNFLLYRELEKPFPPGEKKRATKRDKRVTRPGEPYSRATSDSSPSTPRTPSTSSLVSPIGGMKADATKPEDRALVGSLVDSYPFKEHGLIKKTMSVVVQGVTHHLVSYYSLGDVSEGKLTLPKQDPTLVQVFPRLELVSAQNFKASLDEAEELVGEDNAVHHPGYGYAPNGYDVSRMPMMMGAQSPGAMYPPYNTAGPSATVPAHGYGNGPYYPQQQGGPGSVKHEDFGAYSQNYQMSHGSQSSSSGVQHSERGPAGQQPYGSYRPDPFGLPRLKTESSGTSEAASLHQQESQDWSQAGPGGYVTQSPHQESPYQNMAGFGNPNQQIQHRGSQDQWSNPEAQQWHTRQPGNQQYPPGSVG